MNVLDDAKYVLYELNSALQYTSDPHAVHKIHKAIKAQQRLIELLSKNQKAIIAVEGGNVKGAWASADNCTTMEIEIRDFDIEGFEEEHLTTNEYGDQYNEILMRLAPSESY